VEMSGLELIDGVALLDSSVVALLNLSAVLGVNPAQAAA
jgi:hypothetical protein